MGRAVIIVLAGLIVCAGNRPVEAQTLRGSKQAMQRQHRVAVQHDYTFLRTAAEVRRFVEAGYLVRLPGNADYELASVSYPYGRPALKLFVERLASQYRAACGEKLVVTSLTRPRSEQPGNAHALSVHPAGMAVDLRISGRAACRNWLERTLLSLERQGVLDAIRENRPPHYHIALFPTQYTQYVARLGGAQPAARLASAAKPEADPAGQSAPRLASAAKAEAEPAGGRLVSTLEADPDATAVYRVNRGDSLWSIARRHNTTIDELKALNNLRNSRIVAGQLLSVPTQAANGADSSP